VEKTTEELNDQYSSPNVIQVIKSKRMRWAGHVARSTYGKGKGRGEVHRGFWWENPMERDHLEDPSVDGRIILKWIFSSCKRSNELPCSIKGAEFLD